MKRTLGRIMPESNIKRQWLTAIITVFLAILLTIWGVYGIEEYGIALFVVIPVFTGFCATILYGTKKGITLRESRKIAFLSLFLYFFCLLFFAIEGLICIIMALPFAMLLTWFGSLCGYMVVEKIPNQGPTSLILIVGLFPVFGYIDQRTEPELTKVVTAIEINASAATVWKNVIEFPELQEPTEFIFKTGIAYPINATIQGKGENAVRYCNFTTGSFVEPITAWDEGKLLKFDVIDQPEPMKELSFWDIDAPHLHDYFVSKKGQFKLTRLPNGNTLLEGTTWYYHDIKPAFYWQFWSEYIVHKIHYRVLEHIKKNSENE